MALNFNTSVVLHGIGQGMLIATTGEVYEIPRGQNLSLQLTATDEKVFGGDSLYPFFSFLKEKGGKLSIDDAVFNLNQFKVTQNATLNNSTAKKYVREEITISGTSGTLGMTSGVDPASIVCISKLTGASMSNVGTAGTPSAATQFKGTAAGAITFGTGAVAGVYIFSYYATDATATASAIIMSNAVPGFSELRWKMTTQDEAGNSYDINIRAKKVKTSGTFNMDFGRDKASVQKLEFELYEPADGSKEFVEVSVTDL